jgi:diketogulonate reductase-like aldo/keto reductase
MYFILTSLELGIKQAIAEGICTREELFITTKLWNDFHKAEDVEPHCRDSLEQLGLDYVDLFLMHFPLATGAKGIPMNPSIKETWQAMEALVDKGLTKSIGVSNFSWRKLESMKEYAKYFPVVNQVELHPYLRQDELIAKCKAMGTHVTAYSPLGSPDSALEFNHKGETVLQNEVIQAVAKEVERSPAAVCIKWALQRGTSVVPKSTNPDRIRDNLDNIAWELTPEQFDQVNSLEPQKRMLDFAFWLEPEEGPYKTLDDIWEAGII